MTKRDAVVVLLDQAMRRRLTKDEQIKVKANVDRLQQFIREHGKLGILAFAYVGALIASEEE